MSDYHQYGQAGLESMRTALARVDGFDLGLKPETWFAVTGDNKSSTVRIGDQIGCWDVKAQHLIDSVEGVQDIKLVIDSNGGDSDCAFAILRALLGRTSEARIVGRGAMSAAVIISCAAKVVRIDAGARMMLHAPKNCTFGTSVDLRESANGLDKLTLEIVRLVTARTKQPLDVVNSWFAGDDKYFTAGEAIEVGLADEISNAIPAGEGFDIFTSPAGFEIGGTADEREYWKIMRKLGDIAVKDPDQFRRSAFAWITHHVRQA